MKKEIHVYDAPTIEEMIYEAKRLLGRLDKYGKLYRLYRKKQKPEHIVKFNKKLKRLLK